MKKLPTSDLQTYFSDMYSGNKDPYGVESRWYERRKIDIILSSLPYDFYHSVYEPACGTGVLSVELAKRCDHLHISDSSQEAVDIAELKTNDLENIECHIESLPNDWPLASGKFDLIVLSEILYFLDESEFDSVHSFCKTYLNYHGNLVICNWKPSFGERKLETDFISQKFMSDESLTRLILHDEDDFRLEIFSANPMSVAMREYII